MTQAHRMTDDRKSGLALIIGALGSLLTMAIHPRGSVPHDRFEHMATVSAIAHSLALVSLLLLFLGCLGLTRRLALREALANPAAPDRLALTALVTMGFGAAALLIAASVSGFIGPDVMRYMLHDDPASHEWDRIFFALFQFNQTFARIYSVAASAAFTLWSVSALRNGGLGRFIASYGCILPPLIIVLIAVGHLHLDVHGMAAVVAVHGVWIITVGVQLYRSADQHVMPQKD